MTILSRNNATFRIARFHVSTLLCIIYRGAFSFLRTQLIHVRTLIFSNETEMDPPFFRDIFSRFSFSSFAQREIEIENRKKELYGFFTRKIKKNSSGTFPVALKLECYKNVDIRRSKYIESCVSAADPQLSF